MARDWLTRGAVGVRFRPLAHARGPVAEAVPVRRRPGDDNEAAPGGAASRCGSSIAGELFAGEVVAEGLAGLPLGLGAFEAGDRLPVGLDPLGVLDVVHAGADAGA